MSTIDVRSPVVPVHFMLNGNDVSLDAPAGSRLLDVLRQHGQMKGVKEGCGEGECGACTIVLDGKVACSCLLMAQTVQGCEVITIEGLSSRENPADIHPVQDHFIRSMGTQCGFCTPGMVLSAVVLLDDNPTASRAEILDGISGNLCRCTGYTKIVDAIEGAQKELLAGRRS